MSVQFLINTDYSDNISQTIFFSTHLSEQFRGYYISQESASSVYYNNWDTSGDEIVKINPQLVSQNAQIDYFLENPEQQIRNYYIAQKSQNSNYYVCAVDGVDNAGFGLRFNNSSLQIRKKNSTTRYWLYAIYNIFLINTDAEIGNCVSMSGDYIDHLSNSGDLYYDIFSGNINNLLEITNAWTNITNGIGHSTISATDTDSIKLLYITDSSSIPVTITATSSDNTEWLWLDTELYTSSSRMKSNQYMWVSDTSYDANSGYNKKNITSYVNSAPVHGEWIQINKKSSSANSNDTEYIGENMVIVPPDHNRIYECTLLGSNKPTFDLNNSKSVNWIRTATTSVDKDNMIKIPMTTYSEPNKPTNYNYYRLIMHSITSFNDDSNNDHSAIINKIHYEPLRVSVPAVPLPDEPTQEEEITDAVVVQQNITQIYVMLPSETDFAGVYKTTGSFTGFHTQIEFYFDSSVRFLFDNGYFIENFGPLSKAHVNIMNYSNDKAIAISSITEYGIPIGIGEIILEANKTYELFKKNIPKNIVIPKLIDVKLPGITDYSFKDSVVLLKH